MYKASGVACGLHVCFAYEHFVYADAACFAKLVFAYAHFSRTGAVCFTPICSTRLLELCRTGGPANFHMQKLSYPGCWKCADWMLNTTSKIPRLYQLNDLSSNAS